MKKRVFPNRSGLEKFYYTKDQKKYKELIEKHCILCELIRNNYVYTSNNIPFSAFFAKGNNNYFTTLGINSKQLNPKDYLDHGELIWWQIPITPNTLTEIHTPNPKQIESILKKHEYLNTTIKEIDFKNFDSLRKVGFENCQKYLN